MWTSRLPPTWIDMRQPKSVGRSVLAKNGKGGLMLNTACLSSSVTTLKRQHHTYPLTELVDKFSRAPDFHQKEGGETILRLLRTEHLKAPRASPTALPILTPSPQTSQAPVAAANNISTWGRCYGGRAGPVHHDGRHGGHVGDDSTPATAQGRPDMFRPSASPPALLPSPTVAPASPSAAVPSSPPASSSRGHRAPSTLQTAAAYPARYPGQCGSSYMADYWSEGAALVGRDRWWLCHAEPDIDDTLPAQGKDKERGRTDETVALQSCAWTAWESRCSPWSGFQTIAFGSLLFHLEWFGAYDMLLLYMSRLKAIAWESRDSICEGEPCYQIQESMEVGVSTASVLS
ncbi:hypothetical protein JB92DRAFT_2824786 [Gautieria morchelliformis]|nr:hypothetical protein JB92DRAFT_2824786 [Gautieria morchelliformis]